MKKIKFLLVAVAALISGTAMAQKVTCPDVTIDKGGNAELVFSIESDQPSTLAEFFLTMPEGISIEKNSKGRYLFTKGDMPTEDHTGQEEWRCLRTAEERVWRQLREQLRYSDYSSNRSRRDSCQRS